MKFEQVSNQVCGNFVFNAAFDSGNLGKIEIVKQPTDTIEKQNGIRAETSQNVSASGGSSGELSGSAAVSSSSSKERNIDCEFNLWTRPDCHGTPYENSNRTWFFFSMRGGEKNQMVKFNFMNLNKQAKLFSQGMHPVVKLGSHGKWERIKEKPNFYVTEENFILSFFHKITENVEDNLTFFAFTYPFTCTEQMELLEGYERKFGKSEEELEIIIRELNGIRRDKLVINMNQGFTDEESSAGDFKEVLDVTEDANSEVPLKANLLLASREIDENTSESMQQLSNLVKISKLEENVKTHENVMSIITQDVRSRLDEIRDDIYYYQEHLINSYEERRIDLLTITSFHGIEDKREERLKNLFPDHSKKRCHTFKDKKVIFISSRVHPGETPSSFVLNGFINLLLDKKNQIAATLRKMYVFKIVPFLNPDGVYNGLYRSDTLGVNLNRVYLNPRLDTQPSIYAARKMIRFYHFGFDKPDMFDEIGNPISDDIGECSMVSSDQYKNDDCGAENLNLILNDPEPAASVKAVIEEEPKTMKNESEDIEMTDKTLNHPIDQTDTATDQEYNGRLSNFSRSFSQNEAKPVEFPEASDKKSNGKVKSSNKLKETASNIKEKKTSAKGDFKGKSATSRQQHHHYKHFISHYNSEKHQKTLHQQYFSSQPHAGLNISMDFRVQTDENGEKMVVEESSKLFLYLDLHGHASKKGIFMYGNHLNNTQEAVEVMLLPRLMAMNCHHFAFDACNFSERNMYLKGKRDGLSKEGSGRVAVYKSTGLIKSYTLESNYNMAKQVNILPPKGKEISCKVHNLIPPKFTPSIFEEVGKALGPSLLDLTGSNPSSRIINSEFRSLQGLRNSLKNEISRGLSKARVSKFTKANKKRQTAVPLPPPTVSSAQEMLKENKVNLVTNGSTSSVQQLTKSQNFSQGPKILGNKMKPFGKVQAFGKKDVNLINLSKKKKVLCETSTSASSSAGVGLVNQIPRKKIKVSNLNNIKGESSSNTTTSDSQMKYFLTSSKNLDEEMIPCCSKYQSSLKAPSSPSSSSTGSTNSGTQVKITSFLPIKKMTKGRKLKFGSRQRLSLKKLDIDDEVQSNSAPSNKLLKKKKRSLKSLKKPLLH